MKAIGKRRLIDSDNIPLTVDTVRAVLPKGRRHNITQPLIDEMNLLVNEPEERNVFRENILGYSGVLGDPNISLTVYIEAIKYVSYKMLGYKNQEAWIKTFPHRYQRLLDDKKDAGFIRSTVAGYNKNKTVMLIEKQALMPTYLVNADIHQQAINVQARLMLTAKSEKVRTDAANSLLTHLKQPEVTELKIDVDVKQDESIQELKEATLALVKAQKQNIEAGNMTAGDVIRGKLINGESRRIEE